MCVGIKNIFYSKTMKTERVSLDLKPGRYFWRLKSVEKKKEFFTDTSIQMFKVTKAKALNAPQLPAITNATIEEESENNEYKISWAEQPGAQSYEVEFFQDKKLLRKRTTLRPNFIWKAEKISGLSIRVKSIDTWKRETSYSNYSEVVFP